MAIKVRYSPLMLRKAREMIDATESAIQGRRRSSLREEFCQKNYGLSLDYLKKVGRTHKRPSARVLENLGLELWVRDPETGEMEKLDYDYEWDWNPRNPRKRDRSENSE